MTHDRQTTPREVYRSHDHGGTPGNNILIQEQPGLWVTISVGSSSFGTSPEVLLAMADAIIARFRPYEIVEYVPSTYNPEV